MLFALSNHEDTWLDNQVAFVNLKKEQKKALKLWINLKTGELDDPKHLTKDVSHIGHWGNGDYEIQVKDDENLEYIASLIKQSYKKNS